MSVNLWDKGIKLDPRVHHFTVGDDYLLDRVLLPWDILGSIAHARMLAGIGGLTTAEADSLVGALRDLRTQALSGEFTVRGEHEDGHTAIEAALTERLGEVGRKIHLGRSRNDQVILCLRLYLRDRVVALTERTGSFVQAQFEFLDRWGDVSMPGHTHLQPAMPSSLALWAHAWIESGLESMRALRALHEELNRSPLGAAAGFGSPVPVDRKFVSDQLGFREPQRSVVDVIHSRARLEARVLGEIAVLGSVLEKFACDVSLFLSREFGYFRLDPEFRTGSSIMPQKQNPDIAELLRARAARLRGVGAEHAWIAAKLPSNYHRDYQLLKGPMLRAVAEIEELLEVAAFLPSHLSPDEAALKLGMTADLDAAREASERALEKGVPFRDAYRETAQESDAPPQIASRGVPEHVARESAREREEARQELSGHLGWVEQQIELQLAMPALG